MATLATYLRVAWCKALHLPQVLFGEHCLVTGQDSGPYLSNRQLHMAQQYGYKVA